MNEIRNAPLLTDIFAPGSGAFRIELYEGQLMTGSLNASPSIVREHEIDLDGMWSAERDPRRGGLLIARWLLHGHDYGYDTAHMTTESPCMLEAFKEVFANAPLHAYEYAGCEERLLPDMTAKGAIAFLHTCEAQAAEGSVTARNRLAEGISARLPLNDELVMLRAKLFIDRQQ